METRLLLLVRVSAFALKTLLSPSATSVREATVLAKRDSFVLVVEGLSDRTARTGGD